MLGLKKKKKLSFALTTKSTLLTMLGKKCFLSGMREVELQDKIYALYFLPGDTNLYNDLQVDPFLSVSAAHDIGENVRRQVQNNHNQVAEVFIHIGRE